MRQNPVRVVYAKDINRRRPMKLPLPVSANSRRKTSSNISAMPWRDARTCQMATSRHAKPVCAGPEREPVVWKAAAFCAKTRFPATRSLNHRLMRASLQMFNDTGARTFAKRLRKIFAQQAGFHPALPLVVGEQEQRAILRKRRTSFPGIGLLENQRGSFLPSCSMPALLPICTRPLLA